MYGSCTKEVHGELEYVFMRLTNFAAYAQVKGCVYRALAKYFEALGMLEGFKYNNPQEKERCGCGKSFHV